MQSKKPKTKGRKPAPRSREEREAELQVLAAMAEGKWVLADIAKGYLGIPAGEGVTRQGFTSSSILANEYPLGGESE